MLQPIEALSINTKEELAVVEAEMKKLATKKPSEPSGSSTRLGRNQLARQAQIHHPQEIEMNDLKIFSGTANQSLAKRITDYLGVPLGDIALGKFPDGEISCKIDEDIRGRDVFLIQPTCPPVNEN